jgi:mRNA interferase RelE/StbE
MAYTIHFVPSARKAIDSLPQHVRQRIAKKIDALAFDPFPRASKKLVGDDAYRIRVGDYRVVYDVTHKVLTILVLRVAHRKDVYR